MYTMSCANWVEQKSAKAPVLMRFFDVCPIITHSSTRRTIPVAVPDICLRRRCSLASVDRCHSLRSLHLPLAALPSLPSCLHNISFSFSVGTPLLRCPRTPEDGCPYNYFTNYDAIICKRGRFILRDLLFGENLF